MKTPGKLILACNTCLTRHCSQNRLAHPLFEHASIADAFTFTCWQKWQYLLCLESSSSSLALTKYQLEIITDD